MKVLHYSLGFPPYRAGGMTKYCMDLMEEEIAQGNHVELLWPGRMYEKKTDVSIVKQKNKYGIENYEIINPMPVPLLGGVGEVEAYMKKTDKDVFVKFLKEKGYEAIHVHTLMGLPKEFLEAAKELNVVTIFTTHDYFGLCPNISLIYQGKNCEYDKDCISCAQCNKNAVSIKKIRIKQSLVYRKVKSIKLLNKLKKFNHKPMVYEEATEEQLQKKEKDDKSEKYVELQKYYKDMLDLMTKIHYNSSGTEKVYKSFGVNTARKVINISHKGIGDHRKKREYGEIIRFGYLGSASSRKGFFLLKNVLDKLEEEYKGRFELHLYSKNYFESDYIVEHKPYSYAEMDQVMDSIDILVLPSIWHETYGFTVQEALSYGVPVLVSENVGAKDIVEDGKNGIICSVDEEDLRKKLVYILQQGAELLESMNGYILECGKVKNIQEHAKEMVEFMRKENA